MNADFKLLRSHFPGWSNIEKGTRFAMSLKTVERFLCFQRPVHFSVYAGPVDLKIKRAEVPDCMGGKKVVIRRFFTWKTTAFDLNYSRTTKAIWYSHEEKSPLENDPNFSRYTFLGRVKDEADDEYIQEAAEELQNEMNARGGYSYFQNNYWDFAFSLFRRIQYHGEGEGSG
ncbi:hypothetical protein BDW62DRAFT_131927 [Aspergillus aurantiobrunneus]